MQSSYQLNDQDIKTTKIDPNTYFNKFLDNFDIDKADYPKTPEIEN